MRREGPRIYNECYDAVLLVQDKVAAALRVRGKLLRSAECRGPRFRGKGVLCSHGHLRAVFYTRGLDRSSISCHRTVSEACELIPWTEIDTDWDRS